MCFRPVLNGIDGHGLVLCVWVCHVCVCLSPPVVMQTVRLGLGGWGVDYRVCLMTKGGSLLGGKKRGGIREGKAAGFVLLAKDLYISGMKMSLEEDDHN